MSAWTLDIDDGAIAWLTFDLADERVNKFTEAALRELDELLAGVASNPEIRALVIRSGKDATFIVGADIDELARIEDMDDARAKADAGHWVFGKIADLRIPTVAMIHGPCLGGGLEMALACQYRMASDHPKTSLGLPEVGLGIIPGWGGTQRLPRLIGLPQGMKMILSGKPVDGRKAYKIGLADKVVAFPFLEEETCRFIDHVLTRDGRAAVEKRRVDRQRGMPNKMAKTAAGRAIIYRQSKKQVNERTKGHYPAPLAAIDVIRRTYRRRNMLDGLAIEKQAFAELACTSISRHLVQLFQLSQRFRKDAGGSRRQIQPVDTVGVIGGGIMGGGIAMKISQAGIPVRLKEINWDAAQRGMAGIARTYGGLVKKRRMSKGEVNLAMHRISPTVDYHGFENLDVVIEAVIEDMDIKARVLRELEEAVGPNTIICTNTSSLSLRELAATLKNPRRFVGLHFFNPVPKMPLVEVVGAPKTTRRALLTASELVRRMGKTPIVVGDCAGFLVNRILLPYLIESAWMFEEGVDVERIDTILEQFGMPMGPLALVDEVGLDVGYEVAKVLENAYGDRMHVPGALGAVAESGDWLGRKNGQGFYLYNNGHKKPNPEVAKIGETARNGEGLRRAQMSDDAILDRAVLIMVNEAARCLEEGVVEDPEAVDLAMVMGTGFAPFRGGLLRYADERGVKLIKQRLEDLAETYGDRFRPAPLISKIAGNGGYFYPRNGSSNGTHD